MARVRIGSFRPLATCSGATPCAAYMVPSSSTIACARSPQTEYMVRSSPESM